MDTHAPDDADVANATDDAGKATGSPARHRPAKPPVRELGTVRRPLTREEIYEDILDHRVPRFLYDQDPPPNKGTDDAHGEGRHET